MGIADYFAGTVSVSKFAQIVHLEMIPQGVIIDGVFNLTGYQRNLFKAHYVEKRYSFIGVPASLANILSGKVTVTDIDGSSHTVSFDESVNDGSSGTAIFENYSNSVVINKMSPHMRTVEVTERTGILYCNGNKVV
jgi:hypothetical protein